MCLYGPTKQGVHDAFASDDSERRSGRPLTLVPAIQLNRHADEPFTMAREKLRCLHIVEKQQEKWLAMQKAKLWRQHFLPLVDRNGSQFDFLGWSVTTCSSLRAYTLSLPGCCRCTVLPSATQTSISPLLAWNFNLTCNHIQSARNHCASARGALWVGSHRFYLQAGSVGAARAKRND